MKKVLIILLSIVIVLIIGGLSTHLMINNKSNNKVTIEFNNQSIELNVDDNGKVNHIESIKEIKEDLNEVNGKQLEEAVNIISDYIVDKDYVETGKANINVIFEGKNGTVDTNKISKQIEENLKNNNIETTVKVEEIVDNNKNDNSKDNKTNKTETKVDCNIKVLTTEYEYDGTEKKPVVEVYCNKEKITPDKYTVNYSNNINAGTAKVTVNINKKDYSTTYKINKAIASIGNCTYPKNNGTNQKLITGGVGVTYSNDEASLVGNYNVLVKPDSNHIWSDNTTKEKVVSCRINMTSNNNPIEAYFINMTEPNNGIYSNESVLLVTREGKTIVIDVSNNSKADEIIYNYLKNIEYKDYVDIDYMFISHPHGDHFYGLNSIANGQYSDKIKIKNFYYKNTNINDSIGMTQAINLLNQKNIVDKFNIVNNYNNNTKIQVDSLNSLRLFNLNNVYEGMDCHKNEKFKAIDFRKYNGNTSDLICAEYNNGNCSSYFYIDISKPHTLTKGAYVPNQGTNWYAFNKVVSSDYICNENANSIAILVETSTTNGNKYIYIPSDLENNAYSPFGEYNKYVDPNSSDVKENNKWYQAHIFGGSGLILQYKDNTIKTVNEFCNSNGVCFSAAPYKKASESRVANSICNYLTDNNCRNDAFRNKLNNIVIYQQSHHGYNNALDAINTLHLNRSELYTIMTTSGEANPNNTSAFSIARTCSKNLSKTKMRSTGKTIKGIPEVYVNNKIINAIRCNINIDGITYCDGTPACGSN